MYDLIFYVRVKHFGWEISLRFFSPDNFWARGEGVGGGCVLGLGGGKGEGNKGRGGDGAGHQTEPTGTNVK